MHIIQINAVPYGSTGRIMFSLADAVKEDGHDALCTVGFTWNKSCRKDTFLTGSFLSKSLHMVLARITGRLGLFSKNATKKLIKRIDEFSPDIIHLHNIHGWYLNLPVLFNYIKQKNIRVIWTLHDCWAFTGHCPHYTMIDCNKWQKQCFDCPQYDKYPATIRDYSLQMYNNKKRWFSCIEDLTIVTPSKWLKEQVEKSFLKDYTVEVIHNGINLDVFKPIKSNIRRNYNIEKKFVVLGVAYAWDDKKGLDTFIHLARHLSSDYQIVLIGTDDRVDTLLPDNIISVHRTESQHELAEWYSSADVFVNPTKEDTFPTVNIEALACGTPVVTYDVGGSPEILDLSSGFVIDKGNISNLIVKIHDACENNAIDKYDCVKRAQNFDENNAIREYLTLYRNVK